MTMPTLIANHQKKVTVEKLKQSYNIIAQTVELAKIDYDDIRGWDCSVPNACTQEEFAQKYIIPYLKGTKVTTYRSLVSAGYKEYPKTLSGATTLTGWKYFIKTGQGYLYMVDSYIIQTGDEIFYNVAIDINASSPPNIYGKDIFLTTLGYNINPNNHYKFNMYNYYNWNRGAIIRNDCKKGGLGDYCGALIQQDDWEIKDDYPW